MSLPIINHEDNEEVSMSKMDYLGPGVGYKCQECGFLSNLKPNMRSHVEAKHLDLIYPCHVCGKLFKTYKTMCMHLKSH